VVVVPQLKPLLLGAAMCAVCAGQSADNSAPQTSEKMTSIIRAGLPAYEPKPAAPKNTGTNAAAQAGAPDSPVPAGVVRMRPFLTLEQRLPSTEVILTEKGKADMAMDKYIGDRYGLNRGVLNRYTIAELWKKIPVLGLIPFGGPPGSTSNQEIALTQYDSDQLKESLEELRQLNAISSMEKPPDVSGKPSD